MHGLRLELLHQQARATGIPLTVIELPREPSTQDYQAIMQKHMERLIKEGFTTSAFGDIYLEDLRSFRENQLKQMGLKACFTPGKQTYREYPAPGQENDKVQKARMGFWFRKLIPTGQYLNDQKVW